LGEIVEDAWTPEDDGLLNAVHISGAIKDHGHPAWNEAVPPVPLEPGEQHIGTSPSRAEQLLRTRIRPEGWSYFRIRVKWAQDPLMAPFFWLLLLPFNLISRLIAQERATQTHEQWQEVGNGWLVITQMAMLQTVPGGLLRIPWTGVSSVKVSASPGGISIVYQGQNYFFGLPPESRLWVYVASRFLALNDTSVELSIPSDFFYRARRAGRIA
jgi:hypothetical protein